MEKFKGVLAGLGSYGRGNVGTMAMTFAAVKSAAKEGSVSLDELE
jgi:hypothetical protein